MSITLIFAYFFCFAFLSLPTFAMTCRNALGETSVVSTNEDYKNLKDRLEKLPQGREKNLIERNEVHELLRSALYPFAVRIGDLGSKVSTAKIKEILNDRITTIKEAPIKTREGASPYAEISPLPSWVRDEIHGFINYNATESENAFFYKFHKREGIATHQSKKVLWIDPNKKISDELGYTHQTFSTVVTPVGEYGPLFAKKLLITTAVMLELVRQDPEMRKLSVAIYNSNKDILSERAMRVQLASYEGTAEGFGPLSGVLEGIVSFHQFISATVGERISDVRTGEQALREIVLNGADPKMGLTADFTSRISMGVIGPMTLTGQYFRQPFMRTNEGKLALSPILKATLAELAAPLLKDARKGRCPMAGLLSKLGIKSANPHRGETHTAPPGLQLVAETYLKVFEKVEQAFNEGTLPQ